MALFRCASGGGGGGQITVTYDSDFYGQTITCTRGQKVYSKVASSSGSVVFVVNEEGDWLIECTIGQDTYSTTASIEFTTSTELVSIPDGTTVLPTDDVETWLACAGIQDKAYTTLSEVLSDSETFNALLGDSNACAYMARCEVWAIPALVPAMTSDTTPSGEASASTVLTDNYAWKALDKNKSTIWHSQAGADQYICYEFPSAVVVKLVSLTTNTSTHTGPKVSTVEASDDGTTWVTTNLGAFVDCPNVNTTYTKAYPDNTTAYKYYRLHITESNYVDAGNQYSVINELQFYSADVTLTDNQYAMSMIGQYDVCCDALLGNATWASAITNSSYWSYILKGTVPIMTSDTTPSGECVANAEFSPQLAYFAFDGTSNMWFGSAAGALPRTDQWVGYLYPTDVEAIVTKYRVNFEQATACTHKLQGYDGTNWVDIGSTSTILDGIVDVSNSTKYKGYRVYLVSQNLPSTQYAGGRVQYCQFYGRIVGTEKIHGTNNESAYYLDGATQTPIVDPSTLSAGTYTFGSTVAKDPSDLTADYTKTIRITPNTKEIVLRPDNALYWWGYISAGCEDCTSANGWSSSSGYSLSTPTHNNYDITITTSTYQEGGVGTKYKITASKIISVTEGITIVGTRYGWLFGDYASKSAYISGSSEANIESSSIAKTEKSLSGNGYAFISNSGGRSIKLDALWYE